MVDLLVVSHKHVSFLSTSPLLCSCLCWYSTVPVNLVLWLVLFW